MRMKSYMNEQELLHSVSEGNQQAFALLFGTYKNKVFSFAHHYTHSSSLSEEITQEVFMKLWIKRETLPGIDNIEAWIITITKNLCFNHLKRKAMELRINNMLSAIPLAEDNVDDYISYKDQLNNLHQALNQLSPQQRTIYSLNRDKGLKNDEIARQLNLTTSTVKNHLVLALKKIRHFMETHPAGMLLLLLSAIKNIFN